MLAGAVAFAAFASLPALAGGGAGSGGAAGGADSTTGAGGPGADGVVASGGGGGGGGTTQGGVGGNGAGAGAGLGGAGGSGAGANGVDGTNGGVAAGGGGGGGGTAGLVSPGSATTTTAVSGGTGGSGGGGVPGGGGGGGGGGGFGAIVDSGTYTITVTGNVAGGTGGAGGFATVAGGSGGSGGVGTSLGSGATLSNSGIVTGGAGGAFGGDAGFGGAGGLGGAGVVGSGLTITNSGAISGGAGGNAISIAGAGGAGILGANLTVINSGAITGGLSGHLSPVRTDAITFTGGTNVLELQPGSLITGNVVAFSATDTLRLGGSGAASFDVSTIGLAGQYQGFGIFQKTGSGMWTLTGSNATVTPWVVQAGTLAVSADDNLGAVSGGLGFAGGTLQYLTGFASTRAVTLNAGGGTVNTNGNDATLAGTIDGPGGLTKTGAGTLSLFGNNTYGGGTILQQGTLHLGHDHALGTGTLTTLGSVVSYASGVTIANPILLNSNGTQLEVAFGFATQAGAISQTGGARPVEKIGNGALILTGINSYSGGTTISAGTLQIGTSGTQGVLAGAVTVAALPATLSIVNADVSGMTSIVNNGLTEFLAGTTAGNLVITNNRTLDFSGGASAGNASITTGPASLTRFFDTSTAGNASIVNNDFVQLTETATTGAATVTNTANFVFFNSSTAGAARFTNTGQLTFQASSSATSAVINNTGGEVFFTGNSTAANATINNAAAGSIAFFDSASGGSAAVTNNGLFAISGLASAGTTVGSIGGGGDISLGDKNLSFGSLNTDTEISGVIFGDGGSLTKLGTGTTILSGDNEYTGTTTISQGVLQIGNGGATGSVAGNVVNNSVLAVNRSGAFDYAGVISGTGVLNHIGTGTTTLLGHNTFTGTTTVDAGTLLVNGTLGGPLAVLDGGRLGGNGTVGTTTAVSGGTIAPGNSIGTLQVAGNVTVAAGSIYEVEIDAAGQSDLLAATGTVTLGGGEVVVLDAPGSYAAGTTYTIITAAGGVSGAFDGVTDSLPLLDAVLSYLPVSVLLTLEDNAQLIAALGITPNQRATGAGIDSLGGGALETALSSLGIGDIPPALDLLSGEIHASIKSALIEESRYLREAASNRIRLAFDAVGAQPLPVSGYDEAGPIDAEADTPLAMWGEVLGAWGSFDGDGNAAELDRSIGGFFTGIDVQVADDMRLGLIGGYTHSSFDVDDRASSGSANAAHLGAYGGGQVGNLGVRAVAAYSWNFVDTSRTVAFDGFAESLDADYDAGTAQLFGEVGYRIDKASASFEPFANVAYVNLHTDSFAESGGAAALTQASDNTDQTFTTLGLRAATPFQSGGRSTTLSGMLGWRHAFNDITPDVAFSLVGGAPFVIAGTPIARDALALEAGLDVQLGAHSSLGIIYSGQIGGGAQDHSANARLKVSF